MRQTGWLACHSISKADQAVRSAVTAIFFVSAKTERSSMMVSAADAADALKRAREMGSPRLTVSIRDRNGATYSVEQFEAFLSGHTAAESAEPGQGQAPTHP